MDRRRQLFAEGLAAGMSGKDAAIAAGYSVKSAKVTASRLRHLPTIQAEVERICRGEPLPIHRDPDNNLDAMDFLMSVMRDPTQSISARIRAAKTALPFQEPKRA